MPSEEAEDRSSERAEEENPFRVRAIHIAQIDNRRVRTTIWGDGEVSQDWFFDGYALRQEPRTDFVDVVGSNVRRGESATGRFGYPELSWIDGSNFHDQVEHDGRLLNIYRTERLFDEEMETEVQRQAAIDADTLEPVFLDDGRVLYRYDLEVAPPGSLELPSLFARAIEQHEERIRRREHHRMPTSR